MRRRTVRRAATVFVFTVGLLLAPSASAWGNGSLTASAIEVCGDVTTLVDQYEAIYGPQVSGRERAELRSMTREARLDMNMLVRLVRRAERTNDTADWVRASTHYDAIRLEGDQRLEDARAIIAPRMSLTEQLTAWSQARSVMAELDSLGTQLSRRAR